MMKKDISTFGLTDEQMETIPMYSLGILAMLEIGINVRDRMSQPTYSKHRALLRAYGFDIHERVTELEKLGALTLVD